MNKTNNNIVFKALAILLILTIGLWTASKSMFYHAHLMPNGKIVYHSHPYNKTTDSAPYKSHKHSDAQLSAIDHFNIIIACSIGVFSLILTIHNFTYFIKSYALKVIHYNSTLGRSPPSLLLA